MAKLDRRRIGEILLQDGLVTKEQIEEALNLQKHMEEKKPLGELLVDLGYLSEEGLCLSLSKKLGLKYISLSDNTLKIRFDQELDKLINEDFARINVILPLSKAKSYVSVAMWDPLNFVVIDNIKKMTKMDVEVYCTTKTDIAEGINRLYVYKGMPDETVMKELPVDFGKEIGVPGTEVDELKLRAAEAPIVKMVNHLVKDGIREKASDIHIEPQEEDAVIRYRIDGVLYEIERVKKDMVAAVISRIKILSRLDIAEKRLPQDGGFMMNVDNKNIDIRISSIPTIYGEKLAMRLLDKESVLFALASIGLSKSSYKEVSENIRKPNGLIFLTGPTGSGKTTTLYCILNEIRSPKKNIITIEDPVEYRIDGVNQVQAMPQIGLDFSRGLRSFLRQDPDIIMVGEVRDLETAEICVRAALIGRLVLSTLHTNDSVGTISRLLDFGVEPFLLSSTLNMVIAQRLVRKLCLRCRERVEPDAETVKKYGLKDAKIYGPKPKGCSHCNNRGFSGRMAIFEVMCIDTETKNMIEKKEDIGVIKDKLLKNGMRTLRDDGLDKVKQGITSLDEIIAATIEVE